jgi:hypothetical protein
MYLNTQSAVGSGESLRLDYGQLPGKTISLGIDDHSS